MKTAELKELFTNNKDVDIATQLTNYKLAELYYNLHGSYEGLRKYSRIAMVQQIREKVEALQNSVPFKEKEVEAALIKYDELYDKGEVGNYVLTFIESKGYKRIEFYSYTEFPANDFNNYFRMLFTHAVEARTGFSETVTTVTNALNELFS